MRDETVTPELTPDERRRQTNRARKERKKAAGICTDCPRKAIFARSLCDVCTPKRRAYAKQRARALGCRPREEIPPYDRKKSKAKRRALGLCNDCKEPADRSASRCEKCAAQHRKRERLALKYGRPDYLSHLHEDLPIWQRALLARGQRHILRLKKAS